MIDFDKIKDKVIQNKIVIPNEDEQETINGSYLESLKS